MSACVSRPVSWLRLERYALGELGGDAAAAVEEHLASCPACRACVDHIEADAVVLAPLPTPAPATPWWRRWTVPAGGVLVAAVAVVLLLVARGGGDDHRALPGPRVAVKGGELAVALVREHRGSTAADPQLFVDGDRFAVEVTCPPGRSGVRVEVEQAGERSEPIAIPADFACGNRVALPGAFRVTGDQPVVVCALLDGDRACTIIRPGAGAANR